MHVDLVATRRRRWVSRATVALSALALCVNVVVAIRLNLHYHGLWVDGSFTCSLRKPRAEFHDVSEVTDADVERPGQT